jgi:hypothetical protein
MIVEEIDFAAGKTTARGCLAFRLVSGARCEEIILVESSGQMVFVCNRFVTLWTIGHFNDHIKMHCNG